MTQPNELPNYDRIVDNAELADQLNKAFTLLNKASKNEEEANQNYALAENAIKTDVVLNNLKPSDVQFPWFTWTNPIDSVVHKNVKLAHTKPIEELTIGNPDCTATPMQARFITRMHWATCSDVSPNGETMLELWEKDALQRKSYSAGDAAMVDAHGKKMKNFYSKIRGWVTPPKKSEPKTENQRFLDKINAMVKFLQNAKKLNTKCDIDDIVKNVNNLKKHLQ